jgi:hypothetical protein
VRGVAGRDVRPRTVAADRGQRGPDRAGMVIALRQGVGAGVGRTASRRVLLRVPRSTHCHVIPGADARAVRAVVSILPVHLADGHADGGARGRTAGATFHRQRRHLLQEQRALHHSLPGPGQQGQGAVGGGTLV